MIYTKFLAIKLIVFPKKFHYFFVILCQVSNIPQKLNIKLARSVIIRAVHEYHIIVCGSVQSTIKKESTDHRILGIGLQLAFNRG